MFPRSRVIFGSGLEVLVGIGVGTSVEMSSGVDVLGVAQEGSPAINTHRQAKKIILSITSSPLFEFPINCDTVRTAPAE